MWKIEDAWSSLSNEGFMASNCLTQDGLGNDRVTSFPSILYFVADILFKTNGRICFLKIK